MDAINKINLQPVLILYVKELVINQAFIKIDNKTIELKRENFLYYLDVFFKLYWIFDLAYCNETINFFYFLELIFGINSTRKSSIVELNDLLTN